ncbi:glycosyltransferase [Mycolicibacterium sp. S2-37]|uniref:glycosyltransferase n=1 Tax=Mycolicibacterium sp. S2-37 TaxID=2810297 RepID=UPI0035AB73E6
MWHVHGSWLQSLVAGQHRYLIPVNDARDAAGRGLLGRDWPRAEEIPLERLHDADIDLVVLQRPEEIELVERWTGRRPGADLPAVFVEHNAPRPFAVDSVHPLAGRSDIPIVHVTDFNRLMWDSGAAPTLVIDHGIADPGMQFTGEIAAAATMINEPLRRWRTVGADLLPVLGEKVPIDVWGIGTPELAERGWPGVRAQGDVTGPQLHRDVARRRVYLHTPRWTSLGLSLLEAMFLGMPVVAAATTMASMVVPAEAGVVSADVKTLASALVGYVSDLPAACAAGKAARDFAMAHFSLDRFLGDWDRLIDEVCD